MNIRVRPQQTDLSRYLRWGMAPERKARPEDDGELFVWRTQRDGRVRLEHRRLEGRLLSRRELDEIGWPDSHFGCRCEMVPYRQGETEFAFHELLSPFRLTTGKWKWGDFVNHFYRGRGRPIDLANIGHLEDIMLNFAYQEGALRRWSGQISQAAREANGTTFMKDFSSTYVFRDVSFVHGRSTVMGLFKGVVRRNNGMMKIEGWTEFAFLDEFTDPLDMRGKLGFERATDGEDWTEFGGTPYHLYGRWRMFFVGEVFADHAVSDYIEP